MRLRFPRRNRSHAFATSRRRARRILPYSYRRVRRRSLGGLVSCSRRGRAGRKRDRCSGGAIGNTFSSRLLWIGSWEEIFGEAKRPAAQVLDDSLFSEAEMRGDTEARSTSSSAPTLPNKPRQSRDSASISRQRKMRAIGIIFAQRGALPRLVGTELTHLGFPHNDGLAISCPGFSKPRNGRRGWSCKPVRGIDSFLAFLTLSESVEIFPESTPSPKSKTLYGMLQRSADRRSRVLSTLRCADKHSASPRPSSLGQCLHARTLAEFLQRTETACALWAGRNMDCNRE